MNNESRITNSVVTCPSKSAYCELLVQHGCLSSSDKVQSEIVKMFIKVYVIKVYYVYYWVINVE